MYLSSIVAILVVGIGCVGCVSDFCKNGAKLDSVAFIDTTKQWFFTSGGHYWYLKDQEFPPKVAGTPLPSPFLRGDAAIFINTLDACGKGEQEIHVIEFTPEGNQVMIYDVRGGNWKNPISYLKDKIISMVKIDWSKKIDAAFTFKKTQLIFVQMNRYTIIDIKPICNNNTAIIGDSHEISDLQVQKPPIDAITAIEDNNYINLFQDQKFWKIAISIIDLRISGRKGPEKDVVKVFFRYQETCQLPPKQPEQPLELSSTVRSKSIVPPTSKGAEDGSDSSHDITRGGDNVKEDHKEHDSKSSPWTWITIVAIIVIVIIIALILMACLMARKSKSKDSEEGMSSKSKALSPKDPSVTGSDFSPTKPINDSKPSSKATTPSKTSATTSASKTGTSKAGKITGTSKAGETTGASKTGTKKLSSMGTTPSTMSMRSTHS